MYHKSILVSMTVKNLNKLIFKEMFDKNNNAEHTLRQMISVAHGNLMVPIMHFVSQMTVIFVILLIFRVQI